MREFLAVGAALGLAAGLLLTGPAQADDAIRYADGPATITLYQCAETQSATAVEGCSYIFLRPTGAPAYTYLTAPGQVSWQGTLSGDRLTFPAMVWPTLTRLYLSTATVTTDVATGTIDSAGRVQLDTSYSILVDVMGDLCTLTGNIRLSSEGREWISGAGAGRNYDPANGTFALVNTAASPVTATGSCVRLSEVAYDLTAGIGWYLTGSLGVPEGDDWPQTAVVRAAPRIKAHGKTVLLPAAVVTDAGHTAVPTVTWSRSKKAGGTSPKWARVKYADSGKVILRTTGKANRLYVKLRLRAPAVPGFLAYRFVQTWRVRSG